jgi:hypothetical protein
MLLPLTLSHPFTHSHSLMYTLSMFHSAPRQRKIELLPAPLGPEISMLLPLLTSKLRSFTSLQGSGESGVRLRRDMP